MMTPPSPPSPPSTSSPAAAAVLTAAAQSGLPPLFNWPRWARTARLAGAYFHPAEGRAAAAARLDKLAAERVSVIIADSPLGEQYQAWVDDAWFDAVKAMMAYVVEMAHAREMKVVMYHTGLELISPPGRSPAAEHPEWLQRGLDGTPVLFNDVSNDDEHWLHTGIWDFWAHPCEPSSPNGSESSCFRSLAFRRIQDMVRIGIDGLWVDQAYLQSSVGNHHDLWPSSDPCSAAAFRAASGLDLPRRVDWGDGVFRRWVVWRHTQITEYMLAAAQAARAVNPHIVVVQENSSVDTGRATYVAADPAGFLHVDGIATVHEVETIADRMDHGETGMQAASLDQWLAFRTMIAFARAADRGKPSWILTYGCRPRDSAQLAGIVLAEGANFYENKGPQMAASVGSALRRELLGWIAAHEADLYDVDSAAEVGLLYSPRNRDLLDTVAGEPYDAEDSIHFAAYRAAARELYRSHTPLDVVLDTDVERFAHYRVLIAPNLDLMSDRTAAALRAFSGRLITIGSTGKHDEWFEARPQRALQGRALTHFKRVSSKLATAADTGLLKTTAPAAVQIGLRRAANGYRVLIVNTGSTPVPAFTVRLRAGSALAAVRLSAPGGQAVAALATWREPTGAMSAAVPAGIETVALLSLCWIPR